MPAIRTVTIAPNVPCQIALERDGLLNPAGDRVRFDLVDGRTLLADLELAAKITELGPNVDEPFFICQKVTGRAEDVPEWDVWLSPEAEKARARSEESEVVRKLQESIRLARDRRKGPATAPRPVRVQTSANGSGAGEPEPLLDFEEALIVHTNALTDAYARALEYAGQKHRNLIKADDVRTLLITAYIQIAPKGRKAHAA